MSSLKDVVQNLILVFHKYSQQEGDKFTLTKGELKTLLQHELGELLNESHNPKAVDEAMAELDINKDNVVDFQEFMVLFALLTMACHDFFKEYSKTS